MQIDSTIPQQVANSGTTPAINKDNKQISFISILKTLGGTQQKPLQKPLPTTAPTISNIQQQRQQPNEIKEFPTTSPLESLIKTIKTTNANNNNDNNKLEVGTNEIEEIDNQAKKTELSSKPYTVLSEEDYSGEHKDSIVHLKHSQDGRNIASVDTKGTIKSN